MPRERPNRRRAITILATAVAGAFIAPTRPRAGKTANRYAALERGDFTSGERSRRLAARIARGARS